MKYKKGWSFHKRIFHLFLEIFYKKCWCLKKLIELQWSKPFSIHTFKKKSRNYKSKLQMRTSRINLSRLQRHNLWWIIWQSAILVHLNSKEDQYKSTKEWEHHNSQKIWHVKLIENWQITKKTSYSSRITLTT